MQSQKNLNRISQTRKVRLQGQSFAQPGAEALEAWHGYLEMVIQKSLNALSSSTTRETRGLESTVFIKCLSELAMERQNIEQLPPQELTLFSKPVAIYSFELMDRRYSSVEHIFCNPAGKTTVAHLRTLSRSSISQIAKVLSSLNVNLSDEPTTEELLLTLLDHLQESFKSGGGEWLPDSLASGSLWQVMSACKVLSARRSTLRNWENRIVNQYQDKYDHRDCRRKYYSYPYVDGIIPDSNHLLIVFISPLDMNFIDDKVPVEARAPEISLALFDISDLLFSGAITDVVPMLRQGFGRLLFTNMLQETDLALNESYTERASILRYWARVASDGLRGVLSEEDAKSPFDAFNFCKAIAQNVLCAKIPGVENTEVYPFNRALIFREAGSSSDISNKPLEMLVLEASVLSNNPGDRGRYLTSRERRIRGTEDYECSPAHKTINDENIFRFYIHSGDERSLILSRRENLSDEVKHNILYEKWKSRSSEEADELGYRIALPELEMVGDNPISRALFNLMGRLIQNNEKIQMDKQIADPANRLKPFTVRAFTEDFERLRLSVTEQFDDAGLFFHHDHGVRLQNANVLLYNLQNAYFSYLDDCFQEKDIQYKRDGYRQDNLSNEQIKKLLESHRILRNKQMNERRLEENQEQAKKFFSEGQKRAKVVYVSFSWELHDDNMRNLLEEDQDKSGEAGSHEALLGKEFTYTMILVTNQDQEKSVSRLLSEIEDPKLFFQMIMRHIWMEKKIEHEDLESKRGSISGSLNMFAHRIKGYVPEENHGEMDEFMQNLKVFIESKRSLVKVLEVEKPDNLYRYLSAETGEKTIDEKKFAKMLANKATKWCNAIDKKVPKIEILPASMPPLNVLWSEVIIGDGFNIAFKNAVEACSGAAKNNRKITFQVQAQPRQAGCDIEWYLDLVFENSGGPIPRELLEKLNSPVPTAVGKNEGKKSSTGLGVFLTRYQLRENIRRGADLIFCNVGNGRVQTRLRLPAEIIPLHTERTVSSIKTDPQKDYVLYVEDSPKIYKRFQEKLSPVVDAHGRMLFHCRGVLEAVRLAQKRLPVAVLTDLYIFRDETGPDTSKKNGKNLLENILKIANDSGQAPPIWIFSGEDESDIKDLIIENIPDTYHFIGSGEKDLEKCVSPGTIQAIKGKNKAEGPERAAELLNHFLHQLDINAVDSKEKNESEGSRFGTNIRVKKITLKNGKFGPGLEKAYNLLSSEPDDYMVMVESYVNDSHQASKDIAAWFSHKGFPDPDMLLGDLNRRLPLTDHVTHKNLVLLVVADDELLDRIPVRLIYWLLCRNVWLVNTGKVPMNFSEVWRSIDHEDRGPLSRLRHDLKHEWGGVETALAGFLAEVIETIGQLEQIFFYSPETQKTIEESLCHGDIKNDIFQKHLKPKSRVAQTKKEVSGLFDRLSAKIQSVGKKLTHENDNSAKHIQMIRLLKTLLGG